MRDNSRVASYITFLSHPGKLVSSLFETPHDPSPVAQIPAAAMPPLPGAPPVAVSDIAAAMSNSPEPVAQAVAAVPLQGPHGICGMIPSESGTSDLVCSVFGQVMPGIVFFVSILVVISTVIFLYRYYRRCTEAGEELKSLLAVLNRHPSLAPHQPTSLENMKPVMAALNNSVKRLPALAPFVKNIQDSFIQVGPASKGQVLSRPVLEIAEKNSGLDSWTGKNLADEMPNWLTAIGLLTTFIAILLGLQHVRVLTNMDVQGISGLVNGLSGKFFSSIVALGCALAVTVTNHFCSELIKEHWEQVLLKLEGLLPHLSTEQLLFDILKDRQRKNSEL